MKVRQSNNKADNKKSSRTLREEERIVQAYARRQCFDLSDIYSLFNPGNLFMVQERERSLISLLRRHGWTGLKGKKILDLGCGSGFWIRELVKWGAPPENITGIDLLPDLIDQARYHCPSQVNFKCGNAEQLEFPDSTFDLVLQATVFTSVLDPGMKQRMASEMVRVLKPDGLILWYDYHVNNPRNPDVRGVKKSEIYRLFPGCRIRLHRLTLAPPLARFLVPYSWLLCSLLAEIPFLCTHYLGVMQKSRSHEASCSPKLS